MSQTPQMPLDPQPEANVTACANCHTPMPAGLRFCRNCGFRLGEGSAEYTETIRFQNGHQVAGMGPTGGQQPLVSSSFGASAAEAPNTGGALKNRRRRMSGMTWIFLGLLFFFLTAGIFTAVFSPRRDLRGVGPSIGLSPKTFVGVSGFEDAEGGGVTFDNVMPVGSPADLAGLVGGDVIKSFDGQAVDDEDRMSEILRNTPIGKTVEVVYTRDGENHTTKLTTISSKDADRLSEVFRRRPEGQGRFGYSGGDRVEIPGTKMFGVRLDEIERSRPADLAGIQAGDIVITFDKIPIRTRDELDSRIRRAVPYTTVNVEVIRGTEKIEIPVKMGIR